MDVSCSEWSHPCDDPGDGIEPACAENGKAGVAIDYAERSRLWKERLAWHQEQIDQALIAVPAALRATAVKAGDLADLDTFRALSRVPEVKALWCRIVEAQNELTGMLILDGALTDDVQLVEVYGPVTCAVYAMHASELYSKKGRNRLRHIAGNLRRSGLIPATQWLFLAEFSES